MEVSDVSVHTADALPFAVGIFVDSGRHQGLIGLLAAAIAVDNMPFGTTQVEARLRAADVVKRGFAVSHSGADGILQGKRQQSMRDDSSVIVSPVFNLAGIQNRV